MPRKKKKYSLIATIESVERFHERRSIFVVHATLSLMFQAAVWINWYTSYAIRIQGLDAEFVGPRLAISTVMLIFLVGHFTLMRLMESKDKLVIEALRQHESEDDDEETDNLLSDDVQFSPDETDTRAAKLSK